MKLRKIPKTSFLEMHMFSAICVFLSSFLMMDGFVSFSDKKQNPSQEKCALSPAIQSCCVLMIYFTLTLNVFHHVSL
jgi:hypothetical protein